MFLSLIVAQNGSPTPEILCHTIEAALNQMKRCVFLIMRSKIYILFNILIFCTNCSMDLLLQYYLLSHVLHIQLHRYCHSHLLHKLQQGLESSISFLTYLYHRIQSHLFHFEWNIHIHKSQHGLASSIPRARSQDMFLWDPRQDWDPTKGNISEWLLTNW